MQEEAIGDVAEAQASNAQGAPVMAGELQGKTGWPGDSAQWSGVWDTRESGTLLANEFYQSMPPWSAFPHLGNKFWQFPAGLQAGVSPNPGPNLGSPTQHNNAAAPPVLPFTGLSPVSG